MTSYNKRFSDLPLHLWHAFSTKIKPWVRKLHYLLDTGLDLIFPFWYICCMLFFWILLECFILFTSMSLYRRRISWRRWNSHHMQSTIISAFFGDSFHCPTNAFGWNSLKTFQLRGIRKVVFSLSDLDWLSLIVNFSVSYFLFLRVFVIFFSLTGNAHFWAHGSWVVAKSLICDSETSKSSLVLRKNWRREKEIPFYCIPEAPRPEKRLQFNTVLDKIVAS